MNSTTRWTRVWLTAVGALCLAVTVSLNAQVKTETSETSGASSHEVTVERGEVVLVQGNDLVVKMEDGSFRHLANVPESARATVDGQQLWDSRPETRNEAGAHHHYNHNPKNHHYGEDGEGQSLACQSTKLCHPFSGGRNESEVHHPEGTEVHRRWTSNRCLWPEKGPNGLRHQNRRNPSHRSGLEQERNWFHASSACTSAGR